MTGIGSTIYVFNINRRVYRKDEKGRSIGGGPIWREHWQPEIVRSETSRSWITNYHTKVPKKNADPRKFAFSQAQIDELAWVYEHKYLIVRQLERCLDPVVVRAVADLVGFKP